MPNPPAITPLYTEPQAAALMGLAMALGLMLAAMPALACTPGSLPDPACTPGMTNPAVTQDTIDSTICVRGWTATIRPPVEYTSRLKRGQMAQYGYAGRDPRELEEDHLVSLELGGHPTDPRNLWPELWVGQWGAHAKDRLENALRREVCARRLPLAEAQRMIVTDWIAAYQRFVGE